MYCFRSVAFLGVALLIAGCGPAGNELPRGPVKGRVTVGGKPAADVMITFQNDQISVAQGASTDADGKYEFITYEKAGLPAASYKVTVSSAKFLQSDADLYKIEAGKEPTPQKAPPTTVPAKYAQTATSGLSADVKANENPPFDFDLEP